MELKPCPFCGVRPELRQHPICDIIECENPHCPVSLSILQEHPRGDHQKAHMLVAAWNTRAERTCRRMPADDGAVMVMRGGLAMEFPYFECSECGAYVMDNARYCPNCGAKVVEV